MIWNSFGEVAWAKAALPEVLRRYSHGKSEPPQSIDNSGWAFVNKDEKTGRTIGTFEFISTDDRWGERGYRKKLFQQSMEYMTEYLSVEKWLARAFDWAGLGEEVVVVDVSRFLFPY
jgi:RimJ/RimL family protein N-acetyltransferase